MCVYYIFFQVQKQNLTTNSRVQLCCNIEITTTTSNITTPVIRVSQSPSDTEGKRKNGKRKEKNRNKKLLKRVPSYRERNPVFCLQLILCMDFGFLSDNVPHRIASYIEYFLQSYLLFCVLPLLFMKTYIYIYIRL